MTSPRIIQYIERWTLERLVPFVGNARTHNHEQIEQIAASITEFGFVNPILVGSDGVIIAGHARLRAAQRLGMSEVPVVVLDHLSEAQRRALVIADNQLALNAGWDEEMLRRELLLLHNQHFDVELIGLEDQELARLLAEQDAERLVDPDAVPVVPPVPITLPGDLWLLGVHRLLCGDAADRQAVEIVLGGTPPDMVFTDPPYNVDYQGKTSQRLTIDNDALGDDFYDFLCKACTNMIAVCKGAIYICMSCSELHTLAQAFRDAGGHWSTWLIWAKNHFSLGRSDYQRQYEPILYGWPKGAKRHWCGDRDQGDVWFVDRALANREHPTMKPVELVERAVDNSSRNGDTVLDPFAGSGTTLIACERRKRRACLIEIDARYADVICRRWEEFTGKPAILNGDGRAFRDVAQERQKRGHDVAIEDPYTRTEVLR
ncbi:MAG: DNA methylase N-4 [Terriglobia bacterium]|nr:MAG: DNA methylase N-4 [Terriglobia bacterium]